MRPAPKSTRSGGRLSHHQWSAMVPSALVLRVPASGARNGQLARAGAPITTAQVATAMRQPSALAMSGSVRAEITPAHREAHLLDAHGDATLAYREEIHDGLAEDRIDHAPRLRPGRGSRGTSRSAARRMPGRVR